MSKPKSGDKSKKHRRLAADAGSYQTSGSSTNLTAAASWIKLLESAQQMFDLGEYAAALITAQTACEVVIQRAVAKAYKDQGLDSELTEKVMRLCPWSLA